MVLVGCNKTSLQECIASACHNLCTGSSKSKSLQIRFLKKNHVYRLHSTGRQLKCWGLLSLCCFLHPNAQSGRALNHCSALCLRCKPICKCPLTRNCPFCSILKRDCHFKLVVLHAIKQSSGHNYAASFSLLLRTTQAACCEHGGNSWDLHAPWCSTRPYLAPSFLHSRTNNGWVPSSEWHTPLFIGIRRGKC